MQPGREGGGPFGRYFSARPEGSPYPKAELLPRLLARLTDCILAAVLPAVAGTVGGIAAVLYLLFADGLFRGQSPGKRLLGIKVVRLASGRIPASAEIDSRESALRNFPFALALLLFFIPGIGHFLILTVGSALVVFEGWQVVNDKLGLRMGDLFAGTQVVDTKVLVGAAQERLVLHAALKVVRPGSSPRTGGPLEERPSAGRFGSCRAPDAARVLFEPNGPVPQKAR